MIDPLFDDGRVTLYQGDSLELLPGVLDRHGRPEHVLTDPPYGERTKAGARSLGKGRGGKGSAAGRDDHSEGELGGVLVPFAATEMLVRNAIAACPVRRWVVMFCDFQHAASFERLAPEGLDHVRTGVWVKPDGAPQFTGDRPAQGWEAVSLLRDAEWEALVCLHNEDERKRWNAAGKRGVWTHGIERDVPWHPTPKPTGLLRDLLRDFTDPDDLVVDPFGGSASTAVACRAEGRRCVAIELREDFAELAAQRLREGRARPVDRGVPADDKKTGQLGLLGR